MMASRGAAPQSEESRDARTPLARVTLGIVLLAFVGCRGEPASTGAATPEQGGSRAAAETPTPPPVVATTGERALFPVTIRLPSSLGVVDTGRVDAQGRVVGVRCETCHSAGAEAPMAERSGLERFHAGVELVHGPLRCASCHAVDDRAQLHLADDTRIALGEVQRLCAQCHGPQHRDYEHGAHGGMRGYWDLARGPRERNACIVCHSAHAPAYPLVIPAPAPRDRFVALPDSAPEPFPAAHASPTGVETAHD